MAQEGTCSIGVERLNLSDRKTLVAAARRFAWLAPSIYMALSVGLWLAHVVTPQIMGPVTNYTVEVSLIGALAFGGLYALGLALRSTKPRPTDTG